MLLSLVDELHAHNIIATSCSVMINFTMLLELHMCTCSTMDDIFIASCIALNRLTANILYGNTDYNHINFTLQLSLLNACLKSKFFYDYIALFLVE